MRADGAEVKSPRVGSSVDKTQVAGDIDASISVERRMQFVIVENLVVFIQAEEQ